MAGKKKVLEKVAGTFKSTLPQEDRAGRGFDLKRRPIIDPVDDPPYPGIWESPRSLAESAAERVAPESGAMKQLFGVDRDDLYQISQRVGNRPGDIFEPKGSPRSQTASAVMTPRNTQRMQDQLYEASKHPELYKGMHSWYVSDPVYSRLLQLVPKDEADRLFSRFNMFTGMSSPGSDVNTEIARGTAANYFNNLGSFDLFKDIGGIPQSRKRELMEKAIADRNNFLMAHPEIVDVPGHPYHSTSQALPMEKMIANNYAIDMDSPKVPLYIQAFGDPRHPLGFQTDSAVPDAHFTRNIGISDIRRSATPGASASTSEYRPIRQWWRDQVTRPMGIEPVPGQAIVWGVGSKGTGVETALGAPKLEIISDYIMRRARETGTPPDVMRDMVLQGKAFADGGAVGGLGMEAHRKRMEEAQRDRRERAVADDYDRRARNDMLRDASDVMGQGIDFARENPMQAALNTGQFVFDMVRPHDLTDLGVMLAMSSVAGPFAGPITRMAPKVGRMIAPMIGSPLRRATIGGGMIAADPGEMGAMPKYADGGEVRAFSDGSVTREPLEKPEMPDLSNMSFEKAFATARRMGTPTFRWKRSGGRFDTFSTKLAEGSKQIERRVNRSMPQRAAAPAPMPDAETAATRMVTPPAPPGGEDQQPGLPMGMPTRNPSDTERMRAMLDQMMREERTREAEMPSYLYQQPTQMKRGGALRRMQRAS